MAARRMMLPDYGTVSMKGTQYYRTRVTDQQGRRVSLYARTREELYQKEQEAIQQIENKTYRRSTPTVEEYCEKWLLMQSAQIRMTTLIDYTSKVKNYIIKPLGDMHMGDVTADDIRLALLAASKKSASVYKSVNVLYNLYSSWYLPLIEAGKSMPDAVGADAPADSGNAGTAAGKSAPGGTGIVTEEQVQKGYVWMNEVNNNIFDTTYEEIADYFGVEGKFVKEEYSDHMKRNQRYYKWISKDDENHFIYVNFAEKEPNVFTVSAYNTSGFSGTEAIEKYLDTVKAEAAEVDKAVVASEGTKDFSATVTQFAHDDVLVKITAKIPKSGWSYDEKKKCLVANDDPSAFGAGAIDFEVRAKVEDFDYYKDDFENYKDIADRKIGGITFHGRTYKHIGYDWIEYVAQIDDGRALSIGLRKLDCAPGTAPDVILSSMTIK